MEISLDTREFFELIECAFFYDDKPIPILDVLAYFLLAERASKNLSSILPWLQDRIDTHHLKKYSRSKLSLKRISLSNLKILPKEPSTLPFSWAPELHGAFIDPDLSDEVKNSLSDFNKFQLRMNSYCKKIDEALIPKADLLWGKGRDFLRIFS